MVLLLDQVNVTGKELPYWSSEVAKKSWEVPELRVIGEGVMLIRARCEGSDSTVTKAVPLIEPLVAFTRVVPADRAVKLPD